MDIYKDTLSTLQDYNLVTNHYKPYEYTEYDCNSVYENYDVFKIDSIFPMELKHGLLTLKGKEYNIGKLDIKDVIHILNIEGITCTLFKDYEDFQVLPAILLRDFSNLHTKVLDGGRSPILLDTIFHTNTITPIHTRIVTTEVTDATGTHVPSIYKDNMLYFEPRRDQLVHQVLLTESFYVTVDFSPKRLTNKSDVAYLLNFKEK